VQAARGNFLAKQTSGKNGGPNTGKPHFFSWENFSGKKEVDRKRGGGVNETHAGVHLAGVEKDKT